MKAITTWWNAECTLARPLMERESESGEPERISNGGVVLTFAVGLLMMVGVGFIDGFLS